jgi:hypothetical protein
MGVMDALLRESAMTSLPWDSEGLTVYDVMDKSRDNPDNGPKTPPAEGMWVWWRTGQHPQGVWMAMEVSSKEWGEAYAMNKRIYPVSQDYAHGSAGDWGGYSCHACGYLGEGYPEPGHQTKCDGICKRANCDDHPKLDGFTPHPDMTTRLGNEVTRVIEELKVCIRDHPDDERLARAEAMLRWLLGGRI